MSSIATGPPSPRSAAEDVQAAARAHIDPERASIVVVGDVSKFEEPLREAGYGEVEVIHDDGFERGRCVAGRRGERPMIVVLGRPRVYRPEPDGELAPGGLAVELALAVGRAGTRGRAGRQHRR